MSEIGRPGSPSAPSGPSAPVPKRRKRWIVIALAVLVALVILVVLGPSIASTGLVRGIVLGKINEGMNGKVEIKDWSLGWFSGIDVRDVTVMDSQNQEILAVGHIHTDMTLMDALRGNYNLGNTLIEEPNLVKCEIGRNGESNYQALSKPSNGKANNGASEKAQETKSNPLPNVRGNISIRNLRGAIVTYAQGKPQTLFIQPSTVEVKIPDINSAIEEKINLVCKVNDGPEGTITASGTVKAIDAGKMLPVEKITADQNLALANIDLGAMTPFIRMSGIDLELAGTTNGEMAVKSHDGGESVAGAIHVVSLSAGGAAMKGDTIKTAKMDMPIQLAIANGVVTITALKVDSDLMHVDVSGQIPQAALENLGTQKAPGAAGTLKANFAIDDVAKLVNQIPHLADLQQGVTITGGKMVATSDVTIGANSISAKNHIGLTGVTGTNNNRPVKLSNMTIDLAGSEVAAGGKMNFGEVRDLNIAVKSSFATINGGGATVDHLKIDGQFDLAKARQEFAQFADLSRVQMEGTGTLALTTQSNAAPNSPVTANGQVNLNHLKLAISNAQGSFAMALNDENIGVNAVAVVSKNDAATTAEMSALSVTSSDGLIGVDLPQGKPLKVIFAKGGALSGEGSIHLTGDLKRLDDLNSALSGQAPSSTLTSGRMDGLLTFSRAASGTKINGNLNLTDLTAAPYLNGEQAQVSLDATAPESFDSLKATAKIASSFANVDVSDAELGIKGIIPTTVKSAKLAVTSQDLSKAYSLVNAIAPASPGAARLEVRRGSMNLVMNVAAKNENDTDITVSDMKIENLAIQRGQGAYTFAQPITMKLNAVITADNAGRMTSAQVTQLEGKFGVADISMSSPIKFARGANGESMDGAIAVNGKIENATQLLEALDGQPAGSVYPYQGSYTMTQAFASDPASGNTSLKGSIAANDFKVMQNGKVTFTEQKLAVNNDVIVNFGHADHSKDFITVNGVLIDMQSSGALKLNASGVLYDPNNTRVIDPAHPLTVSVDYDLAQLLPIIKPIVAGDPTSAIADLQMAGKHHENYSVTGSFPVGPFNQSAKHLKASGAIAAQSIQTNGLTMSAEVGVTMENGIVTVNPAAAGKTTGTINQGTLDLSSVKCDLTYPTPRLTMPAGLKLMSNVQINSILAQKVLAKIIPTISSSSGGMLSVTVVNCDKLPAGGLIEKPAAHREPGTGESNDGTGTFLASAMGVDLGGSLLDQIGSGALAAIGGGQLSQHLKADLQQSRITFQNGEVTQQSVFAQQDIGTMQLNGGIQLAGLRYDNFTIGLPSKIFGRNAAGGTITIPVGGTVYKPKIDAKALISKQGLQNILGGLTGNGDNNAAPTTGPANAPAQNDNTIGDLLQQLENKKKKKSK